MKQPIATAARASLPTRLGAWLVTLFVAAVMFTGCTTNPATGALSFTGGMSRQEEVALGEEAAPQFLQQYGGEIPSPAINNYVRDLGMRLAAISERPDLPWEFFVVDSPVINAFALPGGKVFFTRGLLSKLTNEAQMAGVLGHEIGHVTALHVNQRIAQQAALQTGLTAVGVAAESFDAKWLQVLGAGAQVGGGMYLLKFGRGHELEADMLGVRYMTKLGYDPIGQVQVMQILQEAAGGGGAPEFLSTHPYPETRIEKLTKLINEKYPDHSQYDTREAAFRQNVLAPLSKLPPPKHDPQAQQQQ